MMTIWWLLELITMIGGGYLFGYLLGMFTESSCVFNKNPIKRLIALVYMMLFSVFAAGKFRAAADSFIAALEVMP